MGINNHSIYKSEAGRRFAAYCLDAFRPAHVWARNSTIIAVFALIGLGRLPIFMAIMLPFGDEVVCSNDTAAACRTFFRYQYWQVTSHTMHGMGTSIKGGKQEYGYSMDPDEPTIFGWTLFAAFAGTSVLLLAMRITEPQISRYKSVDAQMFWFSYLIITIQAIVLLAAALLPPA